MMTPEENDREVEFDCPNCDKHLKLTLPGMDSAPEQVKQHPAHKTTLHAITICEHCGIPVKLQKDGTWNVLDPKEFEAMPPEIRNTIVKELTNVMNKNGDMDKAKKLFGDMKQPKQRDASYFFASGVHPSVKKGSIMLCCDEEEYEQMFDLVKSKGNMAKACYDFIQMMKSGTKQNWRIN